MLSTVSIVVSEFAFLPHKNKSSRVRSVMDKIAKIKQSQEVNRLYLSRMQEIAEAKREAREEGRQEGREEGREEGHVEEAIDIYINEFSLSEPEVVDRIMQKFNLGKEEAERLVNSAQRI